MMSDHCAWVCVMLLVMTLKHERIEMQASLCIKFKGSNIVLIITPEDKAVTCGQGHFLASLEPLPTPKPSPPPSMGIMQSHLSLWSHHLQFAFSIIFLFICSSFHQSYQRAFCLHLPPPQHLQALFHLLSFFVIFVIGHVIKHYFILIFLFSSECSSN